MKKMITMICILFIVPSVFASLITVEDYDNYMVLQSILPEGSQILELKTNNNKAAVIKFSYENYKNIIEIIPDSETINLGCSYLANPNIPATSYYKICSQLNMYVDLYTRYYFRKDSYVMTICQDIAIPQQGIDSNYLKELITISLNRTNDYIEWLVNNEYIL